MPPLLHQCHCNTGSEGFHSDTQKQFKLYENLHERNRIIILAAEKNQTSQLLLLHDPCALSAHAYDKCIYFVMAAKILRSFTWSTRPMQVLSLMNNLYNTYFSNSSIVVP